MAQRRVLYKNAIYHVYSRGNSKRDIFKSQDDFNMFLKICSNTFKKLPFDCLCYCLMNNHYHLLLQTPDANLPDIMRFINQKYAIYFNRKYMDVGYLFQSRYKAKLVASESYLKQLVSYIHLNPIKAKLVSNPIDWQWSSYAVMLMSKLKPNFLNINKLKDFLGGHDLHYTLHKISGYYDQFSSTQLSESLCTNLLEVISNISKLDLALSRKNEFLVEACIKEGIVSTKRISMILDLSERSVRRIKVRLQSRTQGGLTIP